MQYIQIGHRQRMGKDAFGAYLKEALEEDGKKVHIVAYADKLKIILADVLDISVEELSERKLNDDVTRSMLIRLGKTMVVNVGPTVFTDMLHDSIPEGTDVVIITDFRFEPEGINGAYTVNVYRPNTILFEDGADNNLEGFDFDEVVTNNGSLEDLRNKARTMAKDIIINNLGYGYYALKQIK